MGTKHVLKKPEGEYYEKYRQFWQNNLQIIENLSYNIEKSISRLEKNYTDFESVYNEIMDHLDVLSSIYSHYNSLMGKEYLLKLKAIVNKYRKRYSLESINFNVIYYLLLKIKELREDSINEYPGMKHENNNATLIKSPSHVRERKTFSFRWITFERNNVWFIVPFDSISIVDFKDAEISPDLRTSGIAISWNGVLLPVRDHFSSEKKEGFIKPEYFYIITLKNSTSCFAVKRKGKRIYTHRDILSQKIFRATESQWYGGSLRLFGEKHYFLKPGTPEKAGHT